ncbi:glycosyltransferase [Cruoricaptor ignavus]|uniref:glycosyltransferase n=1 Tax=Cruoricaptor ignavus TaxID=1118202 RepID=UPI00370D89C8
MKRKNILFISSWYPSEAEPTNGNFVQRHAEAAGLRENVEVLHSVGITQKKAFRISEEKVNGVKTLIVYYRKSSLKAVNFFRRMWAYSIGFQRVNRPDVVHGNVLYNNLLFAVWLKWFEKIPFVVTEHWTALQRENHPKLSFLQKKLSQFIGNQANKIMPVSENLKQSLQELGIKTPMKVVPNVVNTEVFTPKPKNAEFTFLHISNLSPQKNGDKILRTALKLLDEGYEFKLQIGGDGDVSPLKKIAENSGFTEKIEIFGTLTSEVVAAKMGGAHCFILFSDYENQPCVIAEAFSCGTQVISTKVGGIAEFFPDYAGILLEEISTEALETAMREVLQKSFLHEKATAEFARKTFSPEKIAAQFSEIYEEVLG